MPLEYFFRTPTNEREREHELDHGQIVSHILLPAPDAKANAHYEVQHGCGPDFPLVAAAAALTTRRGIVTRPRIVLGQVAPTPWISSEAAEAIVGGAVDHESAAAAGEAAVSVATPLAHNDYKVTLARMAVKRAILLAAGLEAGGF